MTVIYVKNFSEFPGPRREVIGPNSGEKFRDTILLPAIQSGSTEVITINLDGTAGYGSSFLEEAFGGLVRHGVSREKMKEIIDNLISLEDPSIIEEIKEYVSEAQDAEQ